MPYEIKTNFDLLESQEDPSQEVSFVSPTGFKLTIDNLKFKNAQFLIQLASIPDISLGGAPLSTPMRNIGLHGDKIEYSTFQCTFLVDEYLVNYKEIHDWILAQVTESDTVKKTRDITLSILSSHNNVVRQIQFVDAYPISLSSLPFDSSQTEVQYLTANVEFNYSYFKLI